MLYYYRVTPLIHFNDNSIIQTYIMFVFLSPLLLASRLYSCMVILEVTGPVNSCALNEILQQLIDRNVGITSQRPLTRMG